MNRLKTAVIGTGGAAQLHMQAYAASEHAQLAAVVSKDKLRADSIASEFGARGYTSVEEMLDRERPDAVTIATLEWDHEAPVLHALAAGCHVLCEKNLAHTLAIGEGMIAAARHAGRSLGVNYNYRSVPAHRLIRSALSGGEFGAPALFSAHMHAYLWPHMLDLIRFWFGDPQQITAAIVDDQVQRPPVSAASGRPWVYGATQPEMLYHPSIAVAATLRYEGFAASISSSALIPLEQNFWSFALYGSSRSGSNSDSLAVNAATRANLNGTPSLGRIAQQIAALPPCSYEQSFALSVGGFIDAIRNASPPPVTGEDGLAAMRLDAAAVQAARTGKSVRFRP